MPVKHNQVRLGNELTTYDPEYAHAHVNEPVILVHVDDHTRVKDADQVLDIPSDSPGPQ